MAKGRLATVLVVLAAAVLVAGPGMALYAALPCNSGAPMGCCGGLDGDGVPSTPCGCSMSPVAPAHAVVDGAAPAVALDAAAAPVLFEAETTPPAPAPAVAPEARAAPLFILFVAFLN